MHINDVSLSYIEPMTTLVPILQLHNFYSSESNSLMPSVSDGGIFYHGNPNFSGSMYWSAITLSEQNITIQKFIAVSNSLVGKYSIQSYLENLPNMVYATVYSNPLYTILGEDASGNSAYRPTLFLIPTHLFDHYGNIYARNNQLFDENLTSNDVGWCGPNILLFSGNCTITLLLSYKVSKRNDTLNLKVYSLNLLGLPHNVIVNSTIVKYKGKLNRSIFSIPFNFTIIRTESYVQFLVMNMQWYGEIILHETILKEL